MTASAWVGESFPRRIASLVRGSRSARFAVPSCRPASVTEIPALAASQSAGDANPWPRHASVCATRTARNIRAVAIAFSASASSATPWAAASPDIVEGSSAAAIPSALRFSSAVVVAAMGAA